MMILPTLKSKKERRLLFAIIGFMILDILFFQTLFQKNDSLKGPESANALVGIGNGIVEAQTPIRILSLGGSVTHGVKLASKSLAYPFIISPSKSKSVVKNLACRATGSEYASRCLQSMINSNDVDEKFDVILLEYSLNGIEQIDLLLRRLRDRYPSAIIIYIHLWSLRTLSEDKQTGEVLQDIVMNRRENLSPQELDQKFVQTMADEGRQWKWNEFELGRSKRRREEATNLMQRVNGFIWTLPLNDDPNSMKHWFASDTHHLNENGHAIVAEGIRNLLLQHSIMTNSGWLNPHRSRLSTSSQGSWGRGDQCYIWFETGISPLDHKGGKMKLFVRPDKHAHEISLEDGKSSISFENKSQWSLSLHLLHMIWLEDKYPKAKVEMHHLESPNSDVSSTILSPMHERQGMRVWHITQLSEVGLAKPGWNSVMFEVLEKKAKPLRIVGLTMCGACEDLKGEELI